MAHVPGFAQSETDSLAAALDITGFDVTSGDPGWELTTATSTFGDDSAVSTAIGDNQSATMSVEFIDTIGRGGEVSFDWRVSSSALDKLVFTIFDAKQNTVVSDNISGIVSWNRVSFDIPEGDHTLVWSYVKDINFAINQDRAWVDQLQITRKDETVPQACRTQSSDLNSALDNADLTFSGTTEFSSSDYVCQIEDFTTAGSARRKAPQTLLLSVRTIYRPPSKDRWIWFLIGGLMPARATPLNSRWILKPSICWRVQQIGLSGE